MHNLIVVRDRIIENGFPELMDQEIDIEYQDDLDDALLSYGSYCDNGFYIEVKKIISDASVDVLEGGIAHELAHISKDLKIKNMHQFEKFVYERYKRYRVLDERDTDLEVILRGYGEQLLSYYGYRVTLGLLEYDDNGLTEREVRVLLNLRNE